MKKLFAIAVLTTGMIACSNEKKSGEETKTVDTAVTAPSQAAAADSTAAKAAADSTVNPADSTKK